ncbi:MAG: hypothetical protein GY801_18275 [bacterium]|nr:hypothetical protein [bacterium]
MQNIFESQKRGTTIKGITMERCSGPLVFTTEASVPNIFWVHTPQRRKDARKNIDEKRLFFAPLRLCGEKTLGTEAVVLFTLDEHTLRQGLDTIAAHDSDMAAILDDIGNPLDENQTNTPD